MCPNYAASARSTDSAAAAIAARFASIFASTAEEHRTRLNRNLTRWGLSMVIIGPVVTLATMAVPFAVAG